jgi:lipopolysaccharide export LptBFGC system permease protein LptF
MIFRRYFLKWFFLYTVSIAFVLGFLLNVIEFFEKLMRTSGISLCTILTFLGLRLLPSFFETLPVGSWLALCLMIKDFITEHEWHTMQMLGISHKILIRIVIIAGLTLTAVTLVTKELLITPLSFKAEQFKTEKLKNLQLDFIANKWLQLNNNIMCHIGSLDIAQKRGLNITVIYLSEDFSIEKTITANEFTLIPESQSLCMQQAHLNDALANQLHVIDNQELKVPQLFSFLEMEQKSPSIINLSASLMSTKKIIPKALFNKALFQLFKKFIFYLQLLCYPLLTLILFLLLEKHAIYRLVGLFLPYPIILFSDTFFDFFVSKGAAASMIFIPYAILLLGALIVEKTYIK